MDPPELHFARCERLLAQAARLVHERRFGGGLASLVDAAVEALDALDPWLAGRHPLRHPDDFAAAARLHRRLAQVQDAVPDTFRGRQRAAERPPHELAGDAGARDPAGDGARSVSAASSREPSSGRR